MKKSSRIIKLGDRGNYERTDPDYEDKRMARMAAEYKECPIEFRHVFLNGLSKYEIKYLEDRGLV